MSSISYKEENKKVIKNLGKTAAAIAFVVILISICLAGCSTSSSQNPSSSSGQQSSSTTSEQQSDNQSARQQPGSPGQQPPGASTAILTRAAEILGISSDDFIAAFNNAMPEGGPFGSGQQGQSATPPSGQQGQPPATTSGQQGQPTTPPSGQQMSQSQSMTAIYEKMAEELNISADDIANAMEQAQEELQK